MVSATGDTSTEATVGIAPATVICTDVRTSPVLAVMVAVPGATPVTRPVASTVATDSSLDSHENSTPGMGRPFSSSASADNCRVPPDRSGSARALGSAGDDTSTETTGAVTTVICAVPCALPERAVTVAVPAATPVTRPVASTVATVPALLVQVTEAPVIACPFWSRTSAAS